MSSKESQGNRNRRFSGSGGNNSGHGDDRGRMNGNGWESYRRGGDTPSPNWQGTRGNFGNGSGRKSTLVFGAGMKGILGTAIGQRSSAIMDIYGAIDEYTALEEENRKTADQSKSSTTTVNIWDPFKGENPQCKTLPNVNDNTTLRVDKMQRKEDGNLNNTANNADGKYPRNSKYISLSTENRNRKLIFICAKNSSDSPQILVERIFEDFVARGEATSMSENVLRLIPIDITCKANLEDVVINLRKTLKDRIPEKGFISFDVEFIDTGSERCFATKGDIIALLRGTVTGINADAYISFNNPQYLIFVQIVGTVACLGLLNNFAKYRHYSVAEFKKEKFIKPEKAN